MASTKKAKKRAVANVKKRKIVAKGKKGRPIKRQQRKNADQPLSSQPEKETHSASRVISPDLIPEIHLYTDEEIGQLQIDRLSQLLPEVESLLTKKRHEIAAIEQYGARLGDRFNQINKHWSQVFSRVVQEQVENGSGRHRSESPIKNAKISISRSMDWALREKPPLPWNEVKERLLQNALNKLIEDSQAAKKDNRPFPADIAAKIQAGELPDLLVAYVEKRQKTYENKRKKNTVAQRAGSKAVMEMDQRTSAAG
jgi:hypothetical protein